MKGWLSVKAVDEKYFNSSVKRIKQHASQIRLFDKNISELQMKNINQMLDDGKDISDILKKYPEMSYDKLNKIQEQKLYDFRMSKKTTE